MELIVETKQGKIEGVYSKDQKTRIFKGVPYATPPVGELRFKRPVPKEKWIGIRPCKSFSSKAYQVDQTKGDLYPKEFYSGDLPCMSEDCLYLNIWTPSHIHEKLPVLFWIHGGAFMHGYGSEIEFDGEGLAQKGVIMVSINYRVGALGFLALDELEEENEEHLSGNYGIYDQIAALEWVYDNIEAFGGDKDQITVAGQSAGCMSAEILSTTPLTKGKISKAIFQSAAGLPGLGTNTTIDQVKKYSKELLELLNVHSLKELRACSPENICYGAYEIMARHGGLLFMPHVDGKLLKEDVEESILKGEIQDLSFMIGSTKDELGNDTGPLLEKGVPLLALKLEETGKKNAYVYHFERELPGSQDGAFHSSELWYEFETLERCWRPFEKKDYEIAKLMSTHFANFIKTGDPNSEGIEEWRPYIKEDPFKMIYK